MILILLVIINLLAIVGLIYIVFNTTTYILNKRDEWKKIELYPTKYFKTGSEYVSPTTINHSDSEKNEIHQKLLLEYLKEATEEALAGHHPGDVACRARMLLAEIEELCPCPAHYSPSKEDYSERRKAIQECADEFNRAMEGELE